MTTSSRRRIFWGQSLAQALARAARYHGVSAERLAYRVHEKRHGFVKHPRAVLIEVDPERPARAADAEIPPESGGSPRSAAAPSPSPPGAARARERAPAAAGPPRGERRSRPEQPPVARAGAPAREPEIWDAPDEESLYAAVTAAREIARFAGFELEPRARIAEDRLEVELVGADEARIREAGFELLAEIEQLLPRAVQSLSGRHVRCRLDAAGLREAREASLRELARAAAERALAGGGAELLEPLNPADRRIVHLALAGLEGIGTESLGSGFLKKVKIFPTGAVAES